MTAPAHTNPESRPNLVLVITDQHRADHTGFGGNPVVQTPHLDALAPRGVVSERAYVANPICMPNRSTMITGRLPSLHGTRFNGISLDWDVATFPREVRRSRYRPGWSARPTSRTWATAATSSTSCARTGPPGTRKTAG